MPQIFFKYFVHRFIVSCLPRNLSLLDVRYLDPFHLLDYNKPLVVMIGQAPPLILSTLKYRFPLILGLPLTILRYFSTDNQPSSAPLSLTDVAPSQLSDFYAAHHIFFQKTGQNVNFVPATPRNAPKQRQAIYRAEWLIFLLNLCTVLYLVITLPVSRSEHTWLWYSMWGSIIGSALSLPFSFLTWYRSVSVHSSNLAPVFINPYYSPLIFAIILLGTILPTYVFTLQGMRGSDYVAPPPETQDHESVANWYLELLTLLRNFLVQL